MADINALSPALQCPVCHGTNYSGGGFYANITPDDDTGIGLWTDAQIKAAITMGKRNDGTTLCSTMARYPFTDAQVSDVVVYLESLPAVSKKITATCQ
jgi:mono/diheme cytochrome c family protein